MMLVENGSFLSPLLLKSRSVSPEEERLPVWEPFPPCSWGSCPAALASDWPEWAVGDFFSSLVSSCVYKTLAQTWMLFEQHLR